MQKSKLQQIQKRELPNNLLTYITDLIQMGLSLGVAAHGVEKTSNNNLEKDHIQPIKLHDTNSCQP